VIKLLAFLDPVRDSRRAEAGNHELVRETLRTTSVVSACVASKLPKGATKEEGGTDTGDEARSRHDRVAEVDNDLTLEELPELNVALGLSGHMEVFDEKRFSQKRVRFNSLVEAQAVGKSRVLISLGNDFVDRALSRVDGLHLLLQDCAFG